MEQWVILGVVLFSIAIIAIFFLYKRIAAVFTHFYHNKALHLVIVTKNSQHAIEWRIWSYFFWNRIIGKKKGVVTCIDTGSTDDTLKILRRLKTRYTRMDVVKLHPTVSLEEAIQKALAEHNHTPDKMIVLDLQDSDLEDQQQHSA